MSPIMMRHINRYLAVFLGIILWFSPLFGGYGQSYMVFFKDKNNTSFSLRTPSLYLSGRAIARRKKHGIVLNEGDLPVNPSYVEALGQIDGLVLSHTTRWMNGILVFMSTDKYEEVSSLDFVRSVDLVSTKGQRTPKNNPAVPVEPDIDVAALSRSLNYEQNAQLRLHKMHQSGYTGRGVYVAVLDEGFNGAFAMRVFRHLFAQDRVRYTYDFVREQTAVCHTSRHGTMVLSALAGYWQDVYEGAAYGVDVALFITEESGSEHPIEEYFWLFAAEKADFLGVDIITSSLGYYTFYRKDTPLAEQYSHRPEDLDGMHTVIARAANAAYERGILVLSSAGNNARDEYPRVHTPADSPLVLSVGSVDVSGEYSPFSALGPNYAQQLKPDITAMGEQVVVFAHTGLHGVNGTSLSTPLVTGLMAGLVQYYPHKTHTELRDILVKSAHRYHTPDYSLGHGIPDFLHAIRQEEPTEHSSASETIRIFPNPLYASRYSMGKLYVEFPRFEGVILAACLGNMDGKKARDVQLTKMIDAGLLVVDFTGLSAGVYVLHLSYRAHSGKKSMRAIKVVYRL